MSRVTKWKLEKNKVKVVFRLQFHATHIPQSGWDKLFISFIPADSGKATAKTTKANVRNGTCKWADPIYETTRLLQDAKSKQYDEKLYKLVVAMGSSRASILGEAIINLADYADALKPSVVALPLHGCNHGTILHVTVQLLTSKTGFREFEQQRELRERGLQTGDKHDESSPGKGAHLQVTANEQMDKDGARFRPRSDARELSSVEEEMGNEEYGDSTVGFDGSSNTSESVYAERHDPGSAHEIDSLKSTISGDMNGVTHCQSPHTHKLDTSDSRITIAPGSSDSVQGWGSDFSVDNDLATAYEENNRLRGSLEFAESSFFEFKLEVRALQSQADEIGIETQKFSHILATEISSCEELAREVSLLKLECCNYKNDVERLRSFKLSPQIVTGGHGHIEHYHLLQDIQLRWTKGILVVEDMIRELQSKIYLGFHERDSRFLHSELEALLDTLQDLKHGTGEAISLLNAVLGKRNDTKEIIETSLCRSEQFASGVGFEVEASEPEIMLRNFNIPPLVSQETESIGAIDAMRKHIVDLVRELDGAKVEKEGLARKMGEMECYYEALIQELEENQKQMIGELQTLRSEHSTCLYDISTTKADLELMRQDMNEQILRFAEERREWDALNKELERRATTSDAALRRARLNYSIAVDKLQKDLELLSSQVLSMFETNENIMKQAFSETSQPSFPGYLDVVQNFEESDALKVWRSQNQNMGVRKQLGGDVLLEDLKRSLCFQEELYQKVEEELMEMHSENLHLDIFSRTLRETLSEANSGMKILKTGINELMEKLRVSNESKNLLIVRLQAAMDDVHSLNEYKTSCAARFNDLAVQNQIIEAKLGSMIEENSLLLKKVADREAIEMECKSIQHQYEACLAEKTELSILLKQEASVSNKLQNEVSLLNEELGTLKIEFSELKSLKENLQETVSFFQGKVATLLAFYNKHFTGLSLLSDTHSLDSNTKSCRDIILQLEEMQHNACSKIHQLMEENSNLQNERASAIVSLRAIRSEFLAMKQKFKDNIQHAAFKLDASSAAVENLQSKLETVSNKLLRSSQIEEKYVEQHKELLADLATWEVDIQNLISKDGCLVKEILNLDTLAGEFERSESTVAELVQENQNLFVSLQDKTVESAKLASEVNYLKENLQSLQNELDTERGLKDKLKITVGDLAAQLNKEQDKLQEFSQQQAELANLRQLVADVELHKSRLCHLLSEGDEKLKAQSSHLIGLERQLLDMHEYVIAADVKAVFLIRLYKTRIAELIQEKQNLIFSLQDKTVESSKLASEFNCLQENFQSLQNELDMERGLKDKLGIAVGDLAAQLNKEQDKLQEFSQQKAELVNLWQLVADLELDKSRLYHLLSKGDEKLKAQTSCLIGLESQLSDMHEYLIGADVKAVFLFSMYKIRIQELEQQLRSSDLCFRELQKKHFDLDAMLNCSLANESRCSKENSNLVKAIESVRSDFEASAVQNRVLSDANRDIMVQLEEYKTKLASLEVKMSEDKDQHLNEVEQLKVKLEIAEEEMVSMTLTKEELEIRIIFLKHKLDEQLSCATLLEQCKDEKRELANELSQQILKTEEFRNLSIHLKEINDNADADGLEVRMSEHEDLHVFDVDQLKSKLADAEEETVSLALAKEQLEIMMIVLKHKLDEQLACISLLEEYEDKLMTLRSTNTDLSNKLSHQILKTEEFKNLSIRLKELKNKAEAELLLSHEKREPQGPPVAIQESLRIAFIKEQYETKNQELKQQLAISKRHGEEMLLKLQDAVDEIESRKRSEALHSKRNEELALKLLALDAELQSVLSDNREKLKACDRMKAELECALLSLECCKEEKEKLLMSMHECEKEKSSVAAELSLTKGKPENVAFSVVTCKEETEGVDKVQLLLDESTGNCFPNAVDPDNLIDGEQVEDANTIVVCETEDSNLALNAQILKDDAVYKVMHETPRHALLERELQQSHVKQNSYYLCSDSLQSSINHLHEQLERMKNENSLFTNDLHIDSDCQNLRSELMCLDKANEELRSIFPLYNEISNTGNALERVLALEMELAEALRAKHQSKSHFQSSFLKQHSDEEAVLKSFRDINELIQEMLEVKGRYAAVESELKEMHERYSQLSLQFAEVEGDRQKLKMTLKNMRASRRLMHPNRSSSALNADLSS
ncbi:uncharacterized protein [Coffea arabica]|uniref:C2 NT-type domain-containing protein n=1 Tax=Coffea arabica TaxID=13443 RepID=A0ABM4VW69_COFAR